MIYSGIYAQVVVRKPDGWNNTERDPTPEEAELIRRYVDRYIRKWGAPPLGGGPVSGVGDVTFALPPDN